MPARRWTTHKFGGSSLADADCFRRVSKILLRPEAEVDPDPARGDENRQAVVVSAMSGTTDALIKLVDAAQSVTDIQDGLQAIESRYRKTAKSLFQSDEKVGAHSLQHVLRPFEKDLEDASNIFRAVTLMRSASDQARDLIAGFGELWSARLLAEYIDQELKRLEDGRRVDWIDARQLIVADQGEMGPAIDWTASRSNAERLLADDPADIVVVTGYVAVDSASLQTTLGRNGSDFSASIVGALVEASSITIWTDVSGVMSADPRRVPESEIIPELSYNEAMELAYFGAKVLHPRTMSPAIDLEIPIWIRNTFDPAARGTRIGPGDQGKRSVKGITSVDEIALVNLEGSGMIGVPGTASRLFDSLRASGISVILISQASSEHSICFAVPSWDAPRVESVLQRAFRDELEEGSVQNVEIQRNCSIVAIVGDGMTGTPGIAARFFETLGNARINVKAIAQGSSERNISAVVERADITRALRAVHSGFTLSPNTLSIGIVGPGNVGSVLLEQMAGEVERLRTEFHLDLRVRGLARSSRMLLNQRAIPLSNWKELMEEDGEPLNWTAFEEHLNPDHLPHAVLIDCSASQEVAMRYEGWLKAGIHVVAANKKAGSGPLEYCQRLRDARRQNLTHFLYETTVGAGLPIIETLRDLRQTGDQIISLEGVLSGTLAYLFNVFDGTRPFSAIVKEALDNGYTEPDPRDDLSGMDVARKLVILAREMNMPLELEEIEVESLVPVGLEVGSVESFLKALPTHDEVLGERWQRASEAGRVLRFVGRLDQSGQATVRLEALSQDHPFARMNLTDNIVRFETHRYSDSPLVIQGPGAGRDVTAGGVFADLLRLAAYLGAAR